MLGVQRVLKSEKLSAWKNSTVFYKDVINLQKHVQSSTNIFIYRENNLNQPTVVCKIVINLVFIPKFVESLNNPKKRSPKKEKSA